MEAFTLIVFGALALALIGLIALGAWSPRSIADVTGGADRRRWATQAQVEGADIDEMLDSHNEARRRRGKREVTEREIRERANRAQRESIERALGGGRED